MAGWIATFETLPFLLFPVAAIYGVLKKRNKVVSRVLTGLAIVFGLIAIIFYVVEAYL